jgi:RNA recognition motif-containing protein
MASLTAPVRTPAKPAGHPNQTSVDLPYIIGAEIINGISSLYCTNLPDKLRKHDLRLSLYTLFSTYGTVLDIVAMKTEKMRGQAHIVFKDAQASTQALRALQGFEFFGKPMVCLFSSRKALRPKPDS